MKIESCRQLYKRNNNYFVVHLFYSGKSEFKTIKRLGIFNPRLNTAYLLDMSAVSEEIIKEVETEVICYK